MRKNNVLAMSLGACWVSCRRAEEESLRVCVCAAAKSQVPGGSQWKDAMVHDKAKLRAWGRQEPTTLFAIGRAGSGWMRYLSSGLHTQ
jgi:hypothetical protein